MIPIQKPLYAVSLTSAPRRVSASATTSTQIMALTPHEASQPGLPPHLRATHVSLLEPEIALSWRSDFSCQRKREPTRRRQYSALNEELFGENDRKPMGDSCQAVGLSVCSAPNTPPGREILCPRVNDTPGSRVLWQSGCLRLWLRVVRSLRRGDLWVLASQKAFVKSVSHVVRNLRACLWVDRMNA